MIDGSNGPIEMKLYLDADVWLNFWLDEMLGFTPASHYLEELLETAFRKKWTILISGATKMEIRKKGVAIEDVEEKLAEFKKAGLLEEIEAGKEDIEQAERIYGERKLHRSDALHAALCIRAETVLVTRTKHFDLVKDLVDIKKPEDLLEY
ncbi:MAG: type II toxin-antitoxin system VapC family toxin [Candidatus Hydrothermarchaeales archaeon]